MLVRSENGNYDYFEKGAEWSGDCKNKQSPYQSPIDLNPATFQSQSYNDMQIIMWQESFSPAEVNDGWNHQTVLANFTNGRLAFLDS